MVISNAICHQAHVLETLPSAVPTWRQFATLALVWLPASLIFSVPSFAYVVCASLPPDNIYGIGSMLIEVVYHGAGVALYVTSALVIPRCARLVAWRVRGDEHTAGPLIIGARLMTMLLVPFLATLVMHEGCGSLWLRLWQPCSHEGSFTTNIQIGTSKIAGMVCAYV